MSELNLPACPICLSDNSLFRQAVESASQAFTWYECRECGSVLLSMGGGQWAYQKVGREERSHLLKQPMTAEQLGRLLLTSEESAPPTATAEPSPNERRKGLPPLVLAAIILTTICVLGSGALMILLQSDALRGSALSGLLGPTATPSPTLLPPTPVFNKWDSSQVITAFRQAGLEVGSTWTMTKDDYGWGPLVAVEGTRFLIPSLCEDCGGRIMSFDSPEDLAAHQDYYVRAGEASAALFSWLFDRDNILLQINGDLAEEEARRYEAALNGLTGVSGSMPAAFSTSTPSTSTACRSATMEYFAQLEPLILEFTDTVEVANSTARIALGPPVQELQRIHREIAAREAPTCAQDAHDLLLVGMSNIISAFLDFMSDAGDLVVSYKLEVGMLDVTNALAQLSALARAEVTPTPQVLPTDAPLPTPLPTPMALPAGSSIMVGDWQIQVSRVEFAETMSASYTDRVEKAAGRFAIVFMSVTNRGLSPDTFTGYGDLEIQDAEGIHYKEHPVASLLAHDVYGTDLAVDVNPDATANVAMVFDISKESAYYVLVPGLLADSYGASVMLDIP